MKYRRSVTLITDIEEAARELDPQPMWMVRPQFSRKYASQRMNSKVELVNIATVNLAKMKTFDIV